MVPPWLEWNSCSLGKPSDNHVILIKTMSVLGTYLHRRRKELSFANMPFMAAIQQIFVRVYYVLGQDFYVIDLQEFHNNQPMAASFGQLNYIAAVIYTNLSDIKVLLLSTNEVLIKLRFINLSNSEKFQALIAAGTLRFVLPPFISNALLRTVTLGTNYSIFM
ncbi:unnamed protein product [Leptidea sinapis]|uniref:Uncharacterized protein n=1 Tax=Leptidea sinapis TaxID=189913 RepID=A0A5E4QBR1_9NEOP|nr:unnamed protein product [Leptidea sinapis]